MICGDPRTLRKKGVRRRKGPFLWEKETIRAWRSTWWAPTLCTASPLQIPPLHSFRLPAQTPQQCTASSHRKQKEPPGKRMKKITQNKSHLPRGLCRNASLPPAARPRFTFEPFLLYNSLSSPAEGPPAPQAASTGARRRLSAFPADAKGSRGPGAARPRGGRQGAAGGPGRRAARQARPPRGHSELPAAVGAPRPARPRRRARTPARGPGPARPPARLPETSPRGAPGQEASRRPPPCFQT